MQKKIHESIFIVCFPFLYQEKEIKEKNYQEKEMQKAKWLSEEALHIAEKRNEVKGKGEKEKLFVSISQQFS